MDRSKTPTLSAFHDDRLIATGDRSSVVRAAKDAFDRGDHGHILLFDDETGRVLDVDLRGSAQAVQARHGRRAERSDPETGVPRKRGRPRLGVVSHEVTLLPRHWAWLRAQRGGASAALRRLVDRARRDGTRDDQVRRAQDRTYRFLSGMLGDAPGFEEALRALFAGDRDRFHAESEPWPPDLRAYSHRLAAEAFDDALEDQEAGS